MGDREANLRTAIRALAEKAGRVAAVSSLYETEPMEFTQQPWFLNCAVALETEKMPRQLLRALLAIERGMGRRREKSFRGSSPRAKGPRTIDIDIVLYGDAQMETAELTLPHPAMHQRRFVLAPLAEIAPDAIHPVFMRSARDLRDALPASAGVARRVAGGAWPP